MPLITVTRNSVNTGNTKKSLGYYDQMNNNSKDHLKQLEDMKKTIENTTAEAEAPYKAVS